MSGVVATICRSCAGADPGLAAALDRALAGSGVTVRSGECMSGCAQAPTLAFRAPGKTAYLFGGIGAADIPDLVTFAQMYLASVDGNLADARPLGALRNKALARIPG